MRYAIYFAPAPGTLLQRLGASWLSGQDRALQQPGLAAFTTQAAHYGFHATLKAPFSLRENQDFAELVAACGSFAQSYSAVSAGKLVLSDMDGFLALVPKQQPEALTDLAAAVVRHFDGFRRPPDAAELAQRRKAKLTPRQESHLAQWGYPHVMQDFRFHMTLTRRLSAEENSFVMPVAEKYFSAIIGQELLIDRLCIFRELSPEHPLTIEHFEKLQFRKPAAT